MSLSREKFLGVFCAFLCLALAAFAAARGFTKEVAGVNAYGALAEAFLNGRLDVPGCPGFDCASFQGKTYVIFPPLPALIALPFVALFGFPTFKGFVFLSMVLAGGALALWPKIFSALGVERRWSLWLTAALGFASPLYFDVLKGDGVWFFAQTIAFAMATLALWAAIVRRSLPLACFFVALAFLCRQMAIFYPLFLIVLTLESDKALFALSRQRLAALLLAGAPIVAALAAIFIYNYLRFANPLDTGYGYIANPPDTASIIGPRIADIGLFSPRYLLFNIYYLLFQGFHAEFALPYQTAIASVDAAGTALIVASPWIALGFYARGDRVTAAGCLAIAIIQGITLFYHSNGYVQLNTQRYTLDWLPIAMVLIARTKRPAVFEALPLLVTWGVMLNVVANISSILATRG